MTAPETSFIALTVASFGDMPVLDVVHHRLDDDDRVVDDDADREHETEHRQRVDAEADAAGRSMNVPRSETGTVSSGMIVARQLCRKRKTTRMTRTSASKKVFMISSIDASRRASCRRRSCSRRPRGRTLDCSSSAS